MKLTATFTKGPVSVLAFGLAFVLCGSGSLFADYTIVLKNGGRITVERYWEEKEMVKFHGLGGVIGIARQQIQSILEAGQSEQQGMVIATIKNSQRTPVADKKVPTPGITVAEAKELGSLKAQEEQEVQKMYSGLNQQIKSRKELRWLITRGTSDPAPTLLNSLEAINGRINDLNSRLKDLHHLPEQTRATGNFDFYINSPFSVGSTILKLRAGKIVNPIDVSSRLVEARSVGARLPGYTRSEWELSELRNQLNLLYEERKRLVEKMRQKEMFIGSVPFEAFP